MKKLNKLELINWKAPAVYIATHLYIVWFPVSTYLNTTLLGHIVVLNKAQLS